MQCIFYVYAHVYIWLFPEPISPQFLIIIKTRCVNADVLKMTKKVAQDTSQLKNAYFNELE